MTDFLIEYVELAAKHAHIWGFILVFVLMTIESSFIPFPSEVIMIPAGFLAYRGELLFNSPRFDLALVILFGIMGSIAGAYVNYFLSLWLGRPFLHRYGKYVMLSEATINRAEEIFNEYGDMTTFVCRLVPAIRQLISIPAGLSRMPLPRFTFFTALGAGIWSTILAAMGYYFGSLSEDLSYADMIHRGKDFLHANYIWLFLVLSVLMGGYIAIHKLVMKSKKKENPITSRETA